MESGSRWGASPLDPPFWGTYWGWLGLVLRGLARCELVVVLASTPLVWLWPNRFAGGPRQQPVQQREPMSDPSVRKPSWV